MLKSDFHMHSKEDWHDCFHINYSAKDLIAAAARKKFEVLAITHHNHVFFNNEIKSYAKRKGILLIPGAEATIEGKHVVVINATNRELSRLRRFEDLKKIHDHALIIAPHPYFFLRACLKEDLEKHISCFHAIEYSHFYMRPMLYPPLKELVNGNAKAQRIAEKYRKPVVGTSDCHRLYDLGTTFSWIDCEKKTEDVIEAIKKGRVKAQSRPMPIPLFFRRAFSATLKEKFLRVKKNHTREMCNVSDEPYFKRFK